MRVYLKAKMKLKLEQWLQTSIYTVKRCMAPSENAEKMKNWKRFAYATLIIDDITFLQFLKSTSENIGARNHFFVCSASLFRYLSLSRRVFVNRLSLSHFYIFCLLNTLKQGGRKAPHHSALRKFSSHCIKESLIEFEKKL